jgi:colicin import membrane protein|tara:strand:+ start:4090 stop:4752 length:663 start_codon:yes stop_codon:yes gene_type:complete
MLSERPISLFLAVLFSFILHSLVIYFLVGKWGETTKPSKVISPKYIQAKLVNLDNAVKPKPKKASKPKPKPKPKKASKSKPKPKPKKVSKPKLQEDREEIKRHVPDALEAEKQLALDQDNEKLTASYSAYIMERIEANWNRPPSARRGMEVALIIQLVPTGQVINVTMVKSSGSEAFDRSAQQAVHKVGRFERLQQLDAQAFEKNFRKLRLVFRPDDLRL